ncbi:30S RIBOSOMAL PROTEIN 3 CHLOROPLAST putative-RELATED [Salix viminalis]|uniref:30S RIBOSOMAL PROTEIN 3 CHLOROPLAST putative-RELATED n=1 Tax=Salix viminalis TaxID=40686 RepID=A0A9Q0U0D7_SALVM|nr:30S RIBOSOMAL PROTEIN 3 CHLOROPLAST putative-RELATED [Salix viminalis]
MLSMASQCAPEALTAETPTDTPPSTEAEESVPAQETEKAEVLVKKVEKPRLVLKFIWMEKNIGLALDQVIPGHGTVPLSPYFFWPRKDAWEELKTTLESKPWISQKKMIILLNQATDIINLWQQSGGNLTAQ